MIFFIAVHVKLGLPLVSHQTQHASYVIREARAIHVHVHICVCVRVHVHVQLYRRLAYSTCRDVCRAIPSPQHQEHHPQEVRWTF